MRERGRERGTTEGEGGRGGEGEERRERGQRDEKLTELYSTRMIDR